MTFALLLPSVTAAIDDISVSGVTIKNYSGIAGSWISQPHVMYPNPEGFIDDFSLEFQSLLRGSNAPVDVSYTLNYRYLGSEVGDLSQMPQEYSEMIAKVVLIINALMATDAPYSGKVDLQIVSVSVGARSDPVGNIFHGADLAFKVMELQN